MSQSPETSVDQGREGRAKRYASLDEAFQKHGTPPENQAAIRRIVEGSDVTGFLGYRTYFKIERRGSAALEVHAGYTNGFRSESDAARLAGDLERWPSRRFHGSWGVTHPVARAVRVAPARSSAPRRETVRKPVVPERVAEVCPTCFMEMPLTGVCPNCG